ncbi:Lrp/AsnC family transcriptional regulator [Saccharibacillus kuerlensis]|uniref:AsnC family transcriptional regulator n=1 Tax=Saccharibacillus kuerlensis TaxID=459527 RepID=A0ABQ2L8G3_9BACL|nr:Lrp/AsnC family transcriptional regulator [Saccharibacillus kuerlensis]GGO04646.1 AsnC family transcriptional regulator [Saccharibacillus kuerlensis]
MDSVDKDILIQLQQDARLSMTEIGRRVGLSQPAVAERVKRLEEQGVIEHYRTVIAGDKVGKAAVAFILFRTTQCLDFVEFCRNSAQVVECHRISGEYNYLVKIVVESNSDIEQFENESMRYGSSTTLVSLSSPIGCKTLLPAETLIKL